MSSSTSLRLMKAVHHEPNHVKFPVVCQPKIDGIRGCVSESGRLHSNSGKSFPNRFTQKRFSDPSLIGFDGEFTLGPPTSPLCYRATDSAIMTQAGEPNLTFHVFDYNACHLSTPFIERYALLKSALQRLHGTDHPLASSIKLVRNKIAESPEQYDHIYQRYLAEGYEGAMYRLPRAPYKRGKSTLIQQFLIKRKPWVDAEARIVGISPVMRNNNPLEQNELGYAKRSSSQANLYADEEVGVLHCEGLNGKYKGEFFSVGIFKGVRKSELREWWEIRQSLIDRIIKYRFMDIGEYDLPRHPTFLGFRDPIDLTSTGA